MDMHSVRKQGVLRSRIGFLLSSMDFITTGHSVHCYFHILEMEKYLLNKCQFDLTLFDRHILDLLRFVGEGEADPHPSF